MTDDGAVTIVAVAGEVDLGTAPHLHDVLRAAHERGRDRILLDLSDVTFMDSSGIHEVVVAWRATLGRGRLSVVCPDGPPRMIFELTRVDELVELHARRDDALAALEAPRTSR